MAFSRNYASGLVETISITYEIQYYYLSEPLTLNHLATQSRNRASIIRSITILILTTYNRVNCIGLKGEIQWKIQFDADIPSHIIDPVTGIGVGRRV